MESYSEVTGWNQKLESGTQHKNGLFAHVVQLTNFLLSAADPHRSQTLSVCIFVTSKIRERPKNDIACILYSWKNGKPFLHGVYSVRAAL